MRAIAAIQDLNAQQRAFVEAFIEHGDARQAAAEAGYTGTTVRIAQTQLLGTPHVAIAIAAAARRRLARAVPMALNTLEHLAQNARSEKTKLDASRAILDRAGLVPPAPPKDEADTLDKPLNELSVEELRAMVGRAQTDFERGEAEIAARAKPVNAAVLDLADELLG